MKYCVWSKMSSRYVERVVFNDCGVGIEFTDDEQRAARASYTIIVKHFASVVPGGAEAREWHEPIRPEVPCGGYGEGVCQKCGRETDLDGVCRS